MEIEDNGPESAYPGPAMPGEDFIILDAEGDDGEEQDSDLPDDPDVPLDPDVDEGEDPSPGNSI